MPRFTKQYEVKNNHKRNFEVSLSPIYDEAETLYQIVAILSDVTQQLEYENKILQQQPKSRRK